MSRSLLDDAFTHHGWATLRVLDACLALTPEQLATAVPGTYGSILDTLRHLVAADAGYLAVVTRGEVSRIVGDAMGPGQLRSAAEGHVAAWRTLLTRELDPDEVYVRRRDDGSETQARLGVRLAQALHHGTDHRSQICTALTSIGIVPPEIDVWDYAWAHDALVEIAPAT